MIHPIGTIITFPTLVWCGTCNTGHRARGRVIGEGEKPGRGLVEVLSEVDDCPNACKPGEQFTIELSEATEVDAVTRLGEEG